MTLNAFMAQLERVPEPPRADEFAGVYVLIDGGEVVYVGCSSDVPFRVRAHEEGALIRALKPRYNLTAPAHCGHDSEILDGLGLGHMDTEGWAEHLRGARARAAERTSA